MNQTRLPKFYNFFVGIIFIVSQVTNTTELDTHNDLISSIDTTDYYDYSSRHVPRRYKRQYTNTYQNCEFPNSPPNSAYEIISERGILYSPGDYVKEFSILRITCDNGYKLPPFTRNTSNCLNGQWEKLPPPCLRACPSLMSTKSMTVRCKYDNKLSLDNCIHPVEGTTVYLSCNTFYEAEAAIKRNPTRACRNGEWTPNLPECYAKCGLKSPRGTFNIINGQDAIPGDYPWQVGIYTNTKEFRCGGAIIDQNIVLSAAHCFTNYSGFVHQAENYLVAAGKFYRQYDDDRDEFAQYSTVSRIFVPERYKSTKGLNSFDIAVVILQDSLTLTIRVQPVCIELNEEFENLNYLMNSNGTVTGWGNIQEGNELADSLKELTVPYVPYNKCYDEVPANFREFLTFDKMCGGYLSQGTSVCQGDSGGALVYAIDNRYYVKGIVSTSPSSTESGTVQCNSQQYSLYTTVYHHIGFVRDLVTNYGWKQSIQCARDDCSNEEIQNRSGCSLPNFPPHGKYSLPDKNSKYEPGNYVPLYNAIFLTCNTGYEAVPFRVNQFYCIDQGQWSPTLGTCTSIFPKNNMPPSITTEEYEGSLINLNCCRSGDGFNV